MLKSALWLVPFIAIALPVCYGATLPDPKETARQAVDALLADDAASFGELVSPERRAALRRGVGPGMGSAELAKLGGCRGVPVAYLDGQMPGLPDSSEPQPVIVAFAQPCLVGFTSFTWEPQDQFVVNLRERDRRWYVDSLYWPVTRAPGGPPRPPVTALPAT